MSLDWSAANIKNYKEVIWLDIPKDDENWTQEILEANQRNGRGHYLREDPEDKNSPFVSYFNPVTDALIWGALETQIGTIDEKNYREVWMRLVMADGVYGEGRIKEYNKETDDWDSRSITIEEVYQHIGLRTNVFPKETPTKWYKKMLNRVREVKNSEVKEAS